MSIILAWIPVLATESTDTAGGFAGPQTEVGGTLFINFHQQRNVGASWDLLLPILKCVDDVIIMTDKNNDKEREKLRMTNDVMLPHRELKLFSSEISSIPQANQRGTTRQKMQSVADGK